MSAPILEEKSKSVPTSARPSRPYDNKVQSLGSREPRLAWGEGNQSDESVEIVFTTFDSFSFCHCNLKLAYLF